MRDLWLDVVFPGVLVILVILALAAMVLDSPFGNFVTVGLGEKVVPIHSLTVFLASCTILFFWGFVLRARTFFPRVLLTVAFTMLGYTIYDSIWGAFFISSLGHTVYTSMFELSAGDMDFTLTILSYVAWWGVSVGILVIVWAWERKYIPKIRVKRVVLVVLLNFFLVLWLNSTGFFDAYRVFVYLLTIGLPAEDPHGWVWFIGKAVGMLCWFLVFIDFHRKGTVKGEREDPAAQRYVPWHRHHKKRNRKR